MEEEQNVNTRQTARPEDFRLTYTPVYAGDALLYFLSAAPGNFGPLDPQTTVNTGQPGSDLMDSLPLARQGYLLRNSITALSFIYAHANNLFTPEDPQNVRSDALMNTAFNGIIPATFYMYRGDNGRLEKLLMTDAVNQGIISGPMTTYQVIENIYPPGTLNRQGEDTGFRSDRFKSYYFQNIAALNYYGETALLNDPNVAAAAEYLRQDNIREQMLEEHRIIMEASASWRNVLAPTREAQRNERRERLRQNRLATQEAIPQIPSPTRFPVPTIVGQLSPPRVDIPAIGGPQSPRGSPVGTVNFQAITPIQRPQSPRGSPVGTVNLPAITPIQRPQSPARVAVPTYPTINIPGITTIQRPQSPNTIGVPQINTASPPRILVPQNNNFIERWRNEVRQMGRNPDTVQQPTAEYLRIRYGQLQL